MMVLANNNELSLLDQYGKDFKAAGQVIFDKILERGEIAQRVYEQYSGQYEQWCKQYAGMSRVGVNNYRKVYNSFKTLDRQTAALFAARALYEIAAIGDPVERQGALEWALEYKQNEIVDFQLSYLSNPQKTPDYIRAAFQDKHMSKPQAYALARAYSAAPDELKALFLRYRVQWAQVALYLIDAYKGRNAPAPDYVESRWHAIEAGGESAGAFAFVWYDAGGNDFEYSISDATPVEVALYQQFRRWLRFEALKERQAAVEGESWHIGHIETIAAIRGDNLIFPVTVELLEAIGTHGAKVEIEIDYRIKREFNQDE